MPEIVVRVPSVTTSVRNTDEFEPGKVIDPL